MPWSLGGTSCHESGELSGLFLSWIHRLFVAVICGGCSVCPHCCSADAAAAAANRADSALASNGVCGLDGLNVFFALLEEDDVTDAPAPPVTSSVGSANPPNKNILFLSMGDATHEWPLTLGPDMALSLLGERDHDQAETEDTFCCN